MAIHTFDEYLDLQPDMHALVADGLFGLSGVFHVMPETGPKPFEELFRTLAITFLVDKVLLPPEREVSRVESRHCGRPARCGGPKCSREMRIVSLIDQEGCHRAHPTPSRALARGGCACIPAPTHRAKRPSI